MPDLPILGAGDHAIGADLAARLLRHLDDQAAAMLADVDPIVPPPVTVDALADLLDDVERHRLTIVCAEEDAPRLEAAAADATFPPNVRALSGLDAGTAYVIAPDTLPRTFPHA